MPKWLREKPPSNVPGSDSVVGADAFIGPNPPQAGLFGESAQVPQACLPPAGNFSPQKSSQNAPGAAAPGPPWGPAACIPRKGISWAVTLHRAVPPHTAHPFPASRDPVESASRYGYSGFLKGRTHCLGTGGSNCTQLYFAQSLHFRRRGAHRASVPRQRPFAEGTVAAKGRLSRRTQGSPCAQGELSREARLRGWSADDPYLLTHGSVSPAGLLSWGGLGWFIRRRRTGIAA